ncbi:hypothetical protein [Methylobacter sp. BBA5.1]|nr:hypothetical protein [Methylobacter sp. BBA5.1]
MPAFRNAMDACVEQFQPRIWNDPGSAIISAQARSKARASAAET